MSSASSLDAVHSAVTERRYDAALDGLQTRLRDEPESLLQAQDWGRLFNGSDWFETQDEPEVYLDYATTLIGSVADCVDGLTDRALRQKLASAFINGAQFRLTAHSNGDPRPLMRARARLFGAALSGFSVQREHAFASPVSSARLRLGILFKHLAQDPETTSVLPLFEEARAHGIEVVLFVASDRIEQTFLDYVKPRCDHIWRLSDDLPQAIAQIRHCDIDILLFGNDITAKPSTFSYLSFFRLARLSACCVSSLVTTASPAMDAYFGCPYYKQAGFDRQFDEHFVSMPNPGFAFSFPARQVDVASPITRAHLGLGTDTPLIVSGANQTKLHKGMIAVWAEILRECPEARLLLYPFPPHFGGTRQEVTNRVLGQFAAFGIAQGRVIIAASIPSRDAVVSMLKIADLGLDSFPYTGVTTLVDAVEAGLPTVSLRGSALRSSQGAAILHTAGFDDLVATSIQDYVALALRILGDATLRADLKARLNEATCRVPDFLRPQAFSSAAAKVYLALHGDLAAGRLTPRKSPS